MKTLQPRKENAGNRSQKRMKKIMGAIGIFIVVSFVFCAPMIFSGAREDTIVYIPRDATEAQVRDSLASRLGDVFADRVMRISKPGHIDWAKRRGAYKILKGENPFKVLRRIARGAQQPIRFTINGFRNYSELIERISSRFDFSPDSLAKTLEDPEVLKPYGLTPEQGMGLFFNDSYEAYWTASPREVVDKIGKYYLEFWKPERKEKLAQLGLTESEAIIISSIVDEETNHRRERGHVGRLYINRLKRGMPLQADPTVRFAIGDFSIRRVKGEHLKFPSPYNTYLHPGLPPGPIRTPSKSTIDLMLNSEETEDIYMCAKEDFSGLHNFARTYEEHLANAKRYQQELDNRGIK